MGPGHVAAAPALHLGVCLLCGVRAAGDAVELSVFDGGLRAKAGATRLTTKTPPKTTKKPQKTQKTLTGNLCISFPWND